jgi:hypothetical protein
LTWRKLRISAHFARLRDFLAVALPGGFGYFPDCYRAAQGGKSFARLAIGSWCRSNFGEKDDERKDQTGKTRSTRR